MLAALNALVTRFIAVFWLLFLMKEYIARYELRDPLRIGQSKVVNVMKWNS